MENKPLVIYLENDGMDDSGNASRSALSFVIQNDCECDLAIFRYLDFLLADEAKVKQEIRQGRVILFIINEEREDRVALDKTIAFVRTASPTLPIVVIPHGYEGCFAPDPANSTIITMTHGDRGWINFVKHLRNEWRRNADWLRANTSGGSQAVVDQLISAHHANNPDDNHAGGGADDNERLVAEALRIRLLGSALINREFSATIEKEERTFMPLAEPVYRGECERLASMDAESFAPFKDFLDESIGCGPGDGTCYCKGNVCGFAIDPITFETQITHGQGGHRLAAQILAHRITEIEMLRKKPFADEMNYEHRLIMGLIIRGVPGFTAPLLMLLDPYEEGKDLTSPAAFLETKRQFIPIGRDGKPFA